MSDRWQEIEKMIVQADPFVRLENNGDKIVGAFCDDPYAYERVLVNGRYEVLVIGNTAHAGLRSNLRVMLNFYVPALATTKVIEGGVTWFKDVLKVREKYGLEKWLFEIERHGESGDPMASFSILPEERIDDEMRERIENAMRHDLKSLEGSYEGWSRFMDGV